MKDIREEMFTYAVHKNCGHITKRVGVPCPEGRKGCAVFHFKIVCVKCGDISHLDVETIIGGDAFQESWRMRND